MKAIASNHFLKFKKKSSKELQIEVDNQVKKIIRHNKNYSLEKSATANEYKKIVSLFRI